MVAIDRGTLFWSGVLVAAVVVAHRGSNHLAAPLEKLRRQWGLTALGGGALIGLASASPEIGVSTASALRGVSDIGLGNVLGVTVVTIPLIATTAYAASRTRLRSELGSKRRADGRAGGDESAGDGADGDERSGDHGDGNAPPASVARHQQHLEAQLLHLGSDVVTVLVLPYLAMIAVFAAITVPAPWRGLQPIDGVVMLVAYVAFLLQAVYRGREASADVTWTARELGSAAAGLGALAVGAYLVVRSMEYLVAAFAVPELVGGLFVTAPLTALPEAFATWSVVRSGQVKAGATTAVTNNAVTLSLGLVPLAALASLPIRDFELFAVNVGFVAALPAAYGLLLYLGAPEKQGLTLREVLALDALYVLYVGTVYVAFVSETPLAVGPVSLWP